MLVPIMLLSMIPLLGAADDPPIEANYGFIPNSGEASVSKVDLANFEEVARYYTAPRVGEMIDFEGNPSADANTVDPIRWRTSRIAMDSGGNAWVLNTGADGYRATSSDFPGSSVELQGSVVRIQADTEGLTTHEYPDPVLDFGTDEAVSIFPVGEADDMPRAIAICPTDPDCIWVGFYGSGALVKYQYDEGAGTLTEVDTYYPGEGTTLRYYEMKFAPDGTLFISSRNSTPSLSPRTTGVWSFDPATGDFTSEWAVDSPYSLLISADGQVYATAYNAQLWIRGTGTVSITGAQNLRGMAFDTSGKVWIASTTGASGGDRVCWYDPSDGTSGYITIDTDFGTTPVGLGMDAAGLMWVVCRTDGVNPGFIQAFDPAVGEGMVAAIAVGYRPYAYGDFVVEQQTYKICGFKYLSETETGLENWEIVLSVKVDEEWVKVGDSAWTDANGKYCFTDLPAGDYMVEEVAKPGWIQTYPGDDGKHYVTLPDGATDEEADAPLYYNFENYADLECYDETVWAAEQHPGETRFVDQGNWGTYITYELGSADEAEPAAYPLYAGQYYLAGMLYVFNYDADTLWVKYTTDVPAELLEHCIEGGGKEYSVEGYCGMWTGLTEYHLEVADSFEGFNGVRTFNKKTGYGNPIPGQFFYKGMWDEAEKVADTGWIPVSVSGFEGEAYIAAHGVAWWCGAMCEPVEEIEALGFSVQYK